MVEVYSYAVATFFAISIFQWKSKRMSFFYTYQAVGKRAEMGQHTAFVIRANP
jgi:hypothetical protein